MNCNHCGRLTEQSEECLYETNYYYNCGRCNIGHTGHWMDRTPGARMHGEFKCCYKECESHVILEN